jgi:spermidine synthase
LLALRSEPPLTGADHDFLAAMQTSRLTLHTFYGAALDAYRGDRDAWQNDIGHVMQIDADNPYYRWFVGTAG